MCNCRSHNRETGETPEVLIHYPYDKEDPDRIICVDACIADVIRHLLENGVDTKNSCCGHGEYPPTIAFDYLTKEDAKKIRDLIVQIDDRRFDLFCWKLVPEFGATSEWRRVFF